MVLFSSGYENWIIPQQQVRLHRMRDSVCRSSHGWEIVGSWPRV